MTTSDLDDAPRSDTAPAPRFHSLRWRAGNALVTAFAWVGIGPVHLLTVRGRRTGTPHTVPVVPVTHDDRLWLVAPYGAVAWVHNARAAGTVHLRHGRTAAEYAIREARPEEAGAVLKRYVAIAPKARERFGATKDSPAQDFVAEAHLHPVLELLPLHGGDAP